MGCSCSLRRSSSSSSSWGSPTRMAKKMVYECSRPSSSRSQGVHGITAFKYPASGSARATVPSSCFSKRGSPPPTSSRPRGSSVVSGGSVRKSAVRLASCDQAPARDSGPTREPSRRAALRPTARAGGSLRSTDALSSSSSELHIDRASIWSMSSPSPKPPNLTALALDCSLVYALVTRSSSNGFSSSGALAAYCLLPCCCFPPRSV